VFYTTALSLCFVWKSQLVYNVQYIIVLAKVLENWYQYGEVFFGWEVCEWKIMAVFILFVFNSDCKWMSTLPSILYNELPPLCLLLYVAYRHCHFYSDYLADLFHYEFICCIVADSCSCFLSRNMASSSATMETSAYWAAKGKNSGFTCSFSIRVCLSSCLFYCYFITMW